MGERLLAERNLDYRWRAIAGRWIMTTSQHAGYFVSLYGPHTRVAPVLVCGSSTADADRASGRRVPVTGASTRFLRVWRRH